MALIKREYTDEETIITAKNLNDIQDAVLALEDGLFSVDNDKSGEVITITDASNRGLLSLNIYGKTTQNGTPTPTAPVDLVSVGGGGSITVNVSGEKKSNSMTISTPNGLPGIPVNSGGNYTDASGQQWICDEIDLARGLYVKRVHKITSQQIAESGSLGTHGNSVPYISVWSKGLTNKIAPMSTRYTSGLSSPLDGRCYCTMDGLVVNDIRFTDQDTARTILSNEDSVFLCPLTTPIETPLSAEEIVAYASLRTYKDSTTVSNDAGAYMGLEYVMDAKKYIDRFVASPASARIEYVVLPASKWVGSGSLYSQVVSIDGVTENSRIDLTPSVEQLSIFYEKDITFVTENDGGVVTVYVIGQKPQNDYTIPANIVEVIV